MQRYCSTRASPHCVHYLPSFAFHWLWFFAHTAKLIIQTKVLQTMITLRTNCKVCAVNITNVTFAVSFSIVFPLFIFQKRSQRSFFFTINFCISTFLTMVEQFDRAVSIGLCHYASTTIFKKTGFIWVNMLMIIWEIAEKCCRSKMYFLVTKV